MSSSCGASVIGLSMHVRPAPQVRAPRFGEVDEISDTLFHHFPKKSRGKQPVTKQTKRAPTRILGFAEVVVNALVPQEPETTKASAHVSGDADTVGWLTIVEGPGRGVSASVKQQVTHVGRGDTQDLQLAYGDDSISRERHATIHVDRARNLVLVEDGGKPNPVVLNGKVLNGLRELMHGHRITIGMTTLRFSRRTE